MSETAKTKNDFKRLYRMHQGYFYSNLLHTALELGVFKHLKNYASPFDAAQKLNTHPANTSRFFNGLAAIGLLKKKKALYKNSPLSQTYLDQDSEFYIGDYLLYHAEWNTPLFDNFKAILQNGPPAREAKADDPELWALGATAIAQFQKACTGPALARIISGLDEFHSFGRMLDLAGGPGINALEIIKAHPSLKGVLFDRPAVIEVAQKYIKQYQLGSRLSVIPGNFQADSFGQGYDLILASACLNFVRQDLTKMIKRIHQSLNPGGVFVSIHDGLTHEGTRPASFALSWMPVAMMWQELSLEKGLIAQAMVKAGFKTVVSEQISFGIGEMAMDIGRKV
ncbi:methyltransferase [Dethiosulfatarculus sandiegensis]|uniref:O-methyltransferase n=1 Tax=Dethiosulfatarculus sandiegensis TaxID=1429043 RepID=A0A0D2JVU5_9BACT|nr:methyltransferase [Dethiosulfatarculus sandiegensis]KIX13725.1 O-methyltransferase [Dethiosulfatarculus sandiegensis]